jgi:hypothetical protein
VTNSTSTPYKTKKPLFVGGVLVFAIFIPLFSANNNPSVLIKIITILLPEEIEVII